MATISYEGFEIIPMPQRLVDTNRWSHNVLIRRNPTANGGIADRPFSSATTFETEEEAVKHAVIYAKQIIDGVHPELTVADL
jgi:hypothetical protein